MLKTSRQIYTTCQRSSLPISGLFFASLVLMTQLAVASDNEDEFERRVRPLLIAKCGDCHGAVEPEGALTLTTVGGLAKGGSLGPILTAGKPEQSRLIQAVRYTSKLKMPPDEKLSSAEISILEQWVRGGAIAPGGRIKPRPSTEQGEFQIAAKDLEWWAFQPISTSPPPDVRDPERARTAVDRFILRKLDEQGLTLSAEADRRTLIRRVTFDLTGLPPTLGQVEAFLDDARPNAFARLVDRLLASPQYGERWGRHWLDLARYADTNGGGFDYVYPEAWRYRDYVVRAFNSDKPYDRFLIEQLAGDLLPDDRQPDKYIERLPATGLLTLAPKGLGMQDKQQMIMDVVDDQIDVLGRSLMGLTLSCARCHDHKFDPVATQDYYALAGIFFSTSTLSNTDKNPSYWPELPLETPAQTEARKAYLAKKTANAKAIAAIRKQADAVFRAEARRRLPEYLFAADRLRRLRSQAPPVAHWSFDQLEGSLVKAETGPAGILRNIKDEKQTLPTSVDGKLKRAVRFAGRGDVITFETTKSAATGAPLEFGDSNDFSVAFWLRAAEGYSPRTADTILMAKYASAMWFIALRPGAYNGVYMRHFDGQRTVDVKPAKTQLATLTDGQWRHIAFTSDRNGQGSLFIDGERVGVATIAAVSQASQFSDLKSFQIGPSNNQFRGDIDDLAVWNRLLTPVEISRTFAAAKDSQNRRNITQLEQARPVVASAKNQFSLAQATDSGLAPSIIQRCIDLLDSTEESRSVLPRFESVDDVRKILEQKTSALAKQLAKQLANKKTNPLTAGADSAEFYDKATRKQLAELKQKAQAIEETRVADPSFAMIARDASTPSDLHVHIAGNHQRLGGKAERGFVGVLSQVQPKLDRLPRPPANQSGRLELARWLTSSDHPLTARVFANRVWQWHFGVGLVATSDNFGRLGAKPTHPKLLDWLARRLIENGWSIKSLHREIVLSAVYRQSSKIVPHIQGARQVDDPQVVDAANRLLWRMNRRRLEGEALRDAMLATSGLLDSRIGGTVNQWKAKMFSVDNANVETANYDTRRRSIYLPVVRGAALHEMLQLFDFGDPNSISANRAVTTVAPQALFMLNSSFVLQQAEQFAARLTRDESANTARRIQLAYQLALSRMPTATEQQRALEFLAKSKVKDWRLFCQMLLCLNEFAYID